MAQSPDKIKAFAFDVDGVMTKGGIFCDFEGNFMRRYDAKDGFALRMASMAGYPLGVMTGASAESIRIRLMTSGVDGNDIYLHSRDKVVDFLKFCEAHNLRPDEVMYFGDDVPDIPVMEMCGISAAPCDSADDVLPVADLVLKHRGGCGAIREGIEMIMKAQGRWVFNVDQYKEKF